MKYNKKNALQMAEIYGLGKATVEEICTQFAISKDTFYQWKKNKPDFSDAIEYYQTMRHENIGEMALNGLQLLLTKHEFVEEKTIYETYMEGNVQKSKVVGIQRTKKFVMPSPAMVKLALLNVKNNQWKETSHIDHTTKGESLGFGSFLQQTKPTASKNDNVPHKVDIEEDETYTPDHRQ